MGRSKSHEQFITELYDRDPQIEVLDTYVNSQTMVTCRCIKCNTMWKARPNNLLRGTGCPKCGIEKRAQSRRKSHFEFVAELNQIDSTIKVIGEYSGAQKKILCECCICGEKWSALATNLLAGKGCPNCRYKKSSKKMMLSHDVFVKELESVTPDIKMLEPYLGSAKKILFGCQKCGYEWKTTPSSLLQGHGCPRCANNERYTPESFVRKLKDINPLVEALGTYTRSNEMLQCRCVVCGYEWITKPNYLLQGHGCPRCSHSSTSYFEQVLFEVLKRGVGEENVLLRDTKTFGCEIDLFIKSLNIAIEPGSWRWHKDKLVRDEMKRKLCESAGIKLLTVYTDYRECLPPFEMNCLVTPYTFGYSKENGYLKDFISEVLNYCNMEIIFSEKDWKEIFVKAYTNSRKKSTKEFKEELELILPNVRVLSEYTGALNPIDCMCCECGYEWTTNPHKLLRGHGCKKCSTKARGYSARKSHEQFVEELGKVNPKITLIDKYITSNDHVWCRCKECLHEWKALPGNLLKGKGCPRCARKKSFDMKAITDK